MTAGWALIGAGRHAERNLIRQFQKAADTEFRAVLSRDRARGDAFARQYGIGRVYTSLDALLRDDDVEAIYDASPDGLHAAHAIAAARAGKHVLLEKPLALSVEDAAAAIDVCQRHSVKLGVVFNQRHEEVHREARRLVLAGEIGDVKLAEVKIPLQTNVPVPAPGNWRGDRRMRAGGIINGIGDHAHDTLAFLTGQEIEEVSAFSDAPPGDSRADRVAGMILKLSRGAIGQIAVSYSTRFARRPFEVHGTDGSLIIENSFAYLTGAGEDPGPTLTMINEAGRSVRRFAPSECFRLEIEQFNRAIAGQGEQTTSGPEALRILATGEALYHAVSTGRAARVADFLVGGG